jgi:heterodisulfide reductase subunit C
MIPSASPLRSVSTWQRLHCETCREETNHHKNACVHCGHITTSKTITTSVSYNGRQMVRKVVEKLSKSQRYRLNPLTRG